MLVGLTGGIGSGKSTVATWLAEAGMVVIDADRIARQVVEVGRPALAEIADRFGDRVIADDGALDRAALASIVFADPDERAALEAITHPAIGDEVDRLHQAALADDPGAIVVLDHPLLIETGRVDDFDLLVVVLAPRSVRQTRLLGRRGMEAEDVEARMAAQVDDEARRAVADVILDNTGSQAHLQRQVRDLVNRLHRLAATGSPT